MRVIIGNAKLKASSISDHCFMMFSRFVRFVRWTEMMSVLIAMVIVCADLLTFRVSLLIAIAWS
jgi:hypothetical protein